MVDGIPIRVYKNHGEKGVAFPLWRPMSIRATIWNGESWATNGGRDKIDWSKAPFLVSFRNYKIDACVWKGYARFCRVNSPGNWWNSNRFSTLTFRQRRLFKWVRKHHLLYDYCHDYKRFQYKLPKECSLPKYWPRLLFQFDQFTIFILRTYQHIWYSCHEDHLWISIFLWSGPRQHMYMTTDLLN